MKTAVLVEVEHQNSNAEINLAQFNFPHYYHGASAWEWLMEHPASVDRIYLIAT